MKTVNVGIAGVGNCASSLIQGVEYYSRRPGSHPRDGRGIEIRGPSLLFPNPFNPRNPRLTFSSVWDHSRTRIVTRSWPTWRCTCSAEWKSRPSTVEGSLPRPTARGSVRVRSSIVESSARARVT